MKTALRSIALVLALAVAALTPPPAGAATGYTADDFWNAMGGQAVKNELSELGLGSVTNVQKYKVPQGTEISADAGILGISGLTFYLYWVPGSNTPVFVASLGERLTAAALTKYLFDDDGYLDIGLQYPIMFWVPSGITGLKTSEMPGKAQAQAKDKTHLPQTIPVAQGFNLFGRVAAGPASYISKLGFPDPNGLIVSIARRKEAQRDGSNRTLKIVSASVFTSAPWRGPFGLADTTINGATLRSTTTTDVTTGKPIPVSRTTETWGTASIKNRPYTIYVENAVDAQKPADSTVRSLAFDTNEASLANFVELAAVVSKTLGFTIPVPSGLPLGFVTLSNRNYKGTDPASPPNFDQMMFMGRKDLLQPLNSKLVVHAAAKVFKWDVASGDIDASSEGVIAKAKLTATAKLGPIPLKIDLADFYLTLSKSQQAMGVKVEVPGYGVLDLKAGEDGLHLHIPPECPLRPVGLNVTLTDLTSSDFPVKPNLKDCFSGEIKKIVDGVVGVGDDVIAEGGKIASEAATKAGELGKAAQKALDEVNVKRVAAWGPAIAAHSEAVKAGQNAVAAAQKAWDTADKDVKYLGGKIAELEGAINDLGSEIANLLKRLWVLVSGEVNKLRGERSAKIAERDDRRTEQAAAAARRDAANDLKEKAQKAVDGIPGPNVSGTVADQERDAVAQMAQVEVQRRIAQYASKTLGGELADKTKAQAMLGDVYKLKPGDASKKDPLETFQEERAAAFTDKYKSLGAALTKEATEDFFTDAKKALVFQAVANRIEGATEQALAETVPTLPTMAFGVPVQMGLKFDDSMCLGESRNSRRLLLVSCGRNSFLFRGDGTIETAQPGQTPASESSASWRVDFVWYTTWDQRRVQLLERVPSNTPNRTRFFFDPVDGLIRYVPENSTVPYCLAYTFAQWGPMVAEAAVTGQPCTQKRDVLNWKLVPRSTVTAAAPRGSAVLAAPPLPVGATGSDDTAERTNLKPLKLLPLSK